MVKDPSECKMCGQLFAAIEKTIASGKYPKWGSEIPEFYNNITNSIVHAAKSNRTDKTLLVGITGLAGSGKDTATNLVNRLEHCVKYFDDHMITPKVCPGCNLTSIANTLHQTSVVNLSFATPLKKIAMIVGFTMQQLYDPELKNKVDDFWKISPRQFLQMCGTEMFRNVWRDDVWVEIMRKQIRTIDKNVSSERVVIFVPDVRFPNEAQMIREEGGIVVRINRPGVATMDHASENQVATLPVDLEIVNDCEDADMWSTKFSIELFNFLNIWLFRA